VCCVGLRRASTHRRVGLSAERRADREVCAGEFCEFFDMLALPNDAIVPVDIQRNANWLEVAFKKRGFTTQQLPNNGRPLVFAEYPRKVADAKTILFYMHFDGQPVIPSQWSQKSPWTATLRQRVGAKWEEIDAKRLQDGVIDPEWRIFARSSSDDKGPIMMSAQAARYRQARGRREESSGGNPVSLAQHPWHAVGRHRREGCEHLAEPGDRRTRPAHHAGRRPHDARRSDREAYPQQGLLPDQGAADRRGARSA
jgi:hypothetical protein